MTKTANRSTNVCASSKTKAVEFLFSSFNEMFISMFQCRLHVSETYLKPLQVLSDSLSSETNLEISGR
jgi:hypothetical protein